MLEYEIMRPTCGEAAGDTAALAAVGISESEVRTCPHTGQNRLFAATSAEQERHRMFCNTDPCRTMHSIWVQSNG